MKNRSHRYNINRPRPRLEKKYTKYKMSQNNLVICIKKHLSNIWSSVYKYVKQHWGWFEKSVGYKKKHVPSGISAHWNSHSK